MVAVFGRDGQVLADEVLNSGASLVGEIEPTPHGGEPQVDEQDPASREDVGIESILLQSRKLPTPQQVAPGYDPSLRIDYQVERQLHEQFMPPPIPPFPDLIRKEITEPADRIDRLHPGPSLSEAPVGESISGEQGVFSGRGRDGGQLFRLDDACADHDEKSHKQNNN